MRALIQRVISASCIIDSKTFSSINNGIVVFLGIKQSDNESLILPLAKKLINLKVFDDENSNFGKNCIEFKAEILIIPQFTLFSNIKGNRLSFCEAKRFQEAKLLYDKFIFKLKQIYCSKFVKTGKFGYHMHIHLVNDGPVTIIIDKENNSATEK